MPDIYTDAAGVKYRPAGKLPYSELTPGTPFALPGDSRVHVRAEAEPLRPANALFARLLPAVRHGTAVILLERIA